MSPAKSILIGLMFLILGRVAYWTEPYAVSVDESTYMSIAEVVQRGEILYQDAVDRKPPLLFASYALIGFIFGPWNIHAVHLVFLLLTLFIAFGLTKLVKDPVTGSWIFIGYCLFSSCFPREFISANAEYLMTACLIWAFVLFEKYLFFSCCLMALSIFFKQYSVLIFIPFLLARWIFLPRRILKELLFSLSALVLVVGVIFYYFYSKGALQDFIHYTFLDGLTYVSDSRKVVNHSTSVWTANAGMFFSWLPLWIGFVFWCRQNSKKIREWVPLLAASVGALSTIYLSARYYTHYFVPFLAFLALFGMQGLCAIKSKNGRLILTGLSILTFVVYASFNIAREIVSDRWSFTIAKQKKLYEVSDWIKKNTLPSDRIVVWGMASQIYVLSERGSGTRYIFADFVSGRQPGMKSEIAIPSPGTKEKFIEDIQKNKPLLIIDTSSAELNDYQWFPLKNYPEIYQLISENYQLTANDSGFLIWKRISS